MTRRSPNPARPTRSSASSISGDAPALGPRQPEPHVARDVRCWKRAQSWNTMPTRRDSGGTRRPGPVMVRPPTDTVPAVGDLEAGDDPQQGRLAAAARSEQCEGARRRERRATRRRAPAHQAHRSDGSRRRPRRHVSPDTAADVDRAVTPRLALVGPAPSGRAPGPCSGRRVGNSTTSRIDCMPVEQHDEAVDADAEPDGRRQAVLERAQVVVVDDHGLVVTGGRLLRLVLEAGRAARRDRSARRTRCTARARRRCPRTARPGPARCGARATGATPRSG